jgi:hypothetical protein
MLSIPATINQVVGAVTGFTTPTYSTTSSSTTVPNGKTSIVTAKGGTQPSAVDVHSASRPFSFLSTKPSTVRTVPPLQASGALVGNPVNVYGLSTKKGMTVMSGQPSQAGYIKTSFGIPAGADALDPDNIAAMVLAHSMTLAQIAQEIVNTAKTGEI